MFAREAGLAGRRIELAEIEIDPGAGNAAITEPGVAPRLLQQRLGLFGGDAFDAEQKQQVLQQNSQRWFSGSSQQEDVEFRQIDAPQVCVDPVPIFVFRTLDDGFQGANALGEFAAQQHRDGERDLSGHCAKVPPVRQSLLPMPDDGLDPLGHAAEQQLTIAHNRLAELAIDWREREALALLAMGEPRRIVLRNNIEPAEQP